MLPDSLNSRFSPINRATAEKLIDFSGGILALEQLGKQQLEGAVALHNMIVDPDIRMGYLADEVGMGKTYIALGVVSLLRFFNSSLRVLYITPSRNIQEKWQNDYSNFLEHNFREANGRVRSIHGGPAFPSSNSNNLHGLINDASSGYFGDFFVRGASFSFALSEDYEELDRQLDRLQSQVPARDWRDIAESARQDAGKYKQRVKLQYARALNYVLPDFDLVVIDEAHNFKKGFETSSRNLILSRVLGFNREDDDSISHYQYQPRVAAALLMSATPYDRNLTHLYNQLRMVGKANLLPAHIKIDDKEVVKEHLKRFMVRRLNRLDIDDRPHTRNMYRAEHRKGETAQISLTSDEQKLVMALVQKKVGESLTRDGSSASFQTGMLASFESFAESSKSPPVEFDGDDQEKKKGGDAADKHVVSHISDSYKELNHGKMLPHPKMDHVTDKLGQDAFNDGEKSLVFVRRVKSVAELKGKLDEFYSRWLNQYIQEELSENPGSMAVMRKLYAAYLELTKKKELTVSEGEVGEEDKHSNDNFFTWFFRGELDPIAKSIAKETEIQPPLNFRNRLTDKDSNAALTFELNWAALLIQESGLELEMDSLVKIAGFANRYFPDQKFRPGKEYGPFRAIQAGFLKWWYEGRNDEAIGYLLEYFYPKIPIPQSELETIAITVEDVEGALKFCSIFNEISRHPMGKEIFPTLNDTLSFVREHVRQEKPGSDKVLRRELRKLEIHRELFCTLLRIDHPFIDLYLSRLMIDSERLTAETVPELVAHFLGRIAAQSPEQFSTRRILRDLSCELDLIIKTNFTDIYKLKAVEDRNYIKQRLSPLTPVIGATGETYKGRSNQARKFRMPGYPMILVSTDVFQEGEDLHTFCANVMHYGLSGTPVAIEQKVGRVDRVSSLAHRRLSGNNDQDFHKHFIQVVFPYVKETIEFFQVRSLCRNINEFILSMSEVEPSARRITDENDVDLEVQDTTEIPGQINKLLTSPYEVTVNDEGILDQCEEVDRHSVRREDTVTHVTSLLKQLKIMHCGQDKVDTFIRSTKSSNEFLLGLERSFRTYPLPKEITDLLTFMQKHCWQTFHRTQAVETDKGEFKLYFNAEMLVGDINLTQPAEVSALFERLSGHLVGELKAPDISRIRDCVDTWLDDRPIPTDRAKMTSYRVNEKVGGLSVDFEFHSSTGETVRTHQVEIYQYADDLVFLSRVTEDGDCFSLTPQNLVEYTWLRNRKIDLVEFVPSPEGALMARVTHPITHLQPDEFMYCAHAVAIEADRLEYLLSEEDVF